MTSKLAPEVTRNKIHRSPVNSEGRQAALLPKSMGRSIIPCSSTLASLSVNNFASDFSCNEAQEPKYQIMLLIKRHDRGAPGELGEGEGLENRN